MSADILKKSIYDLIEQIEDVELLAAVYKIIRASKQTGWLEEISPSEKQLIERGIKELDKGEHISHDDVMDEVNKILKRV